MCCRRPDLRSLPKLRETFDIEWVKFPLEFRENIKGAGVHEFLGENMDQGLVEACVNLGRYFLELEGDGNVHFGLS